MRMEGIVRIVWRESVHDAERAEIARVARTLCGCFDVLRGRGDAFDSLEWTALHEVGNEMVSAACEPDDATARLAVLAAASKLPAQVVAGLLANAIMIMACTKWVAIVPDSVIAPPRHGPMHKPRVGR